MARGAPRAATSATIVERLEAAGRHHDRQARDDAAGLGDDGPDARPAACRNPHGPDRVPGGSSSGSAVAVATGIADHAPGTDAGGSVRHPAAACGVVGFKPTYGSVPLDGCMPYAPSFDTGGPIARTVAEAALQYSVIAAAPPVDLPAGSMACASPSSAATSRRRSRTTSRRCSTRARARARE